MSHTLHADSGTYVLELPWSAPPLTENQRIHFRKRAELTREVRAVGRDLGERLVGPLVRPTVTLVWLVTSRHRRDADNVTPTLKALADGLVDAGVARDDTPEHMHKTMPIIAYARGHHRAPGMFLTVWESEGLTAGEVRALSSVGVAA